MYFERRITNADITIHITKRIPADIPGPCDHKANFYYACYSTAGITLGSRL